MVTSATVLSAARIIAGRFLPVLLGKLSGSRAGDLAERVVSTAAGVVGLPLDASVDQIVAKLGDDPEAERRFTLAMMEIERDVYRLELEDRRAARESQNARGQQRADMMLKMVVTGLLACILAVVALGLVGSDTGNEAARASLIALLTTIAGALLKMFSDAFAFEFGSSRGSKNKDDQIEEFNQALLAVGRKQQDRTQEMLRENLDKRTVVAVEAEASAITVAAAAGKRDFVAELEAEAAA
ncbi:hypothetical protein [Salipiger sp. PrR002]|uniref:hypothetical protein n=1 Tax=Salipiger sp. PrR002 TaxID=2706489 RepID=UPI0013B9BFBD|nr:hypothetical protein [Salipiger sp. PrR002]NDW00111.1 hypothetical protein [Salipiger sp. PrR002]NDW56880.1 hypothetical protein [Salipiger sp. PrR004]